MQKHYTPQGELPILLLSFLPMSYRIYHTKGFIIGSHPAREADKVYRILTPDLGLLTCFAQGVRRERSKFRHFLQNFNFIDLSLVRGREYWRVVHAGAGSHVDLRPMAAANLFAGRLAALIRRLVHGEGENKRLFSCVSKACEIASDEREEDKPEFLVNLECLAVLRILSCLGYEISDAGLAQFGRTDDWSAEILDKIGGSRREAIKYINQALKQSHL